MEEELITKKELLDRYGISYGALYRWKRKGLIPDEWFIHKSTYTGQETFLPRDKILKRIDLIMSLKDKMSLDDIADSFVPSFSKARLGGNSIILSKVADADELKAFIEKTGKKLPFDYSALLALSVFVHSRGDIGAANCVLQNVRDGGKNSELIIVSRGGMSISLCASAEVADTITVGEDCTVTRTHISDIISKLENALSSINADSE